MCIRFVDFFCCFCFSSVYDIYNVHTAASSPSLVHIDRFQLTLELGRNGRRRFGRFPQHEALEAAAELLPEALEARLLELDQCILTVVAVVQIRLRRQRRKHPNAGRTLAIGDGGLQNIVLGPIGLVPRQIQIRVTHAQAAMMMMMMVMVVMVVVVVVRITLRSGCGGRHG